MNNVEIIGSSDLTDDDKKTKEFLSKKYFNSLPIKVLRKMKFTSPKGNVCTCFISKEPNDLLGSMVITEINGVKTEQFVHGMPKLHYWMDYIEDIENSLQEQILEFREKLDGTNICLYKLYNPVDNKLIEIIPKTRNMPVLSPEFQELYNSIDTSKIIKYFTGDFQIHTLIFELWGDLNIHTVNYTHKLDLSLLCFYNSDLSLNFSNTKFNAPKVIGRLYKKDNIYFAKLDNAEFKSDNISSLINEIEDYFESLNNGEILSLEGAILNLKLDKATVFAKIKPPSIKEAHSLSNGISTFAIKKEVLKFFDEFGKKQATDIIENNIHTAIEYIQDNLLEEYNEKYVYLNMTSSKIEQVLLKISQRKQIDKKLLEIGEKILKENPEKHIGEIMRIFAKKYPQLKNKSEEMYNGIKELKDK